MNDKTDLEEYEERLEEIQGEFDVEITEEMLEQMPFYSVLVWVGIPALSIIGLFIVTIAYGAIAVSALVGLVLLTILGEYKDIQNSYNIFSIIFITLVSWGVIGIFLASGYPGVAGVLGANMFSFGLYSLIRWNNKFLSFWRFEWLFDRGR